MEGDGLLDSDGDEIDFPQSVQSVSALQDGQMEVQDISPERQGQEEVHRPVPGSSGFERYASGSPQPRPPTPEEMSQSPVPTYEMVEAAGFGGRQLAMEVEEDSDKDCINCR